MRTRGLPLLLLAFLACGRTEPVDYSFDAGDQEEHAAAPLPRKPDGGVACIDGESELLEARPVVMLVIDRSSSMRQDFPGTRGSKWAGLRVALNEALPPWNDTMDLGAIFFP